jgi:hypothetical protein
MIKPNTGIWKNFPHESNPKFMNSKLLLEKKTKGGSLKKQWEKIALENLSLMPDAVLEKRFFKSNVIRERGRSINLSRWIIPTTKERVYYHVGYYS